MTYSNINVCTKCADGFLLANPTTCTKGAIVDCVVYTSATACAKCVDLKMPSGATCVLGTVTGCKTYSANLACSVCNFGYTLSGTSCTGKITNCK